jgi:hypothetical protein
MSGKLDSFRFLLTHFLDCVHTYLNVDVVSVSLLI